LTPTSAPAQAAAGRHDDETRRMTRAAGTVAAATLISRILGFARDAVIAGYFGAGFSADAFLAAFRIPNLFRRLVGEGVLNSAFVPVFAETLHRGGAEEARRLFGAAARVFVAVLAVVSALGVLGADRLVMLIAPGFAGPKLELTVSLARLMFPYLMAAGLMALCMGALNVSGSFAPPALAPALLNVAIIAAVMFLSPHLEMPAIGLGVGVLVGGIAQVAVQLPALRRRGLSPWGTRGVRHPALARIARLMVPAVMGGAVYQINILVGTLLASTLPEGSVSYLYYADRLVEFPLGVVAMAAATAVLPGMSRDAAAGNRQRVGETFGDATRLVSFITLPATAGLILLAEPIVEVLFRRGEFTAADVRLTAQALSYYALGLWSFSMVRIAVAAFFALQDARTPFRAATVCIAANLLLGLLLMGPLAHGGMALAASVASTLHLVILLLLLERRVGRMRWGAAACSVARSAFNTAVMSGGLWLLARETAEQLDGRGLLVGAWVGAGAVLYVAASWATGSPELRYLVSLVKGEGRAS
jgi:putative peptidoglycan lipid II flippase